MVVLVAKFIERPQRQMLSPSRLWKEKTWLKKMFSMYSLCLLIYHWIYPVWLLRLLVSLTWFPSSVSTVITPVVSSITTYCLYFTLEISCLLLSNSLSCWALSYFRAFPSTSDCNTMWGCCFMDIFRFFFFFAFYQCPQSQGPENQQLSEIVLKTSVLRRKRSCCQG